jgi:hypothetical protein
MRRSFRPLIAACFLTFFETAMARDAPSDNELKQVNNPLANMEAFNVQNDYAQIDDRLVRDILQRKLPILLEQVQSLLDDTVAILDCTGAIENQHQVIETQYNLADAGVAERVDAGDLKSPGACSFRVRVSAPAPSMIQSPECPELKQRALRETRGGSQP